jgi:hypothetical protein
LDKDNQGIDPAYYQFYLYLEKIRSFSILLNPNSKSPMKRICLIVAISQLSYFTCQAQKIEEKQLVSVSPVVKTNVTSANDKKVMAEVLALTNVELNLILTQDTLAMKKFFPEEMVVTNPFSQFIDKKKVIERVRGDIIKYSTYEKTVEYFQLEGNDVAIVAGSEIVVPTSDSNRTDAGKTVNRRFTEVWTKRGQDWKKLVRHAHNITN